ncbi:hypothetical protein QTP88_025097 [Uroleucon formosanum]
MTMDVLKDVQIEKEIESNTSEEQFDKLLDTADSEDSETCEYNISFSPSSKPTLETCATTYFAGYLAKKCLDKYKCEDCGLLLISNEQLHRDNHQILLTNKSFDFIGPTQGLKISVHKSFYHISEGNKDNIPLFKNEQCSLVGSRTNVESEDTVLKKLAYSYTSQVCQLSAFSIRNQIGHPYVNIEQQDAAEFISALISLYEPLHNFLLHQLQTILKCSRCKKSRVHISNNYIIQLNVPNDTKTVTMHSMLNDMSKEVTIENITCSACNTTSNHTQTTNILNTHEYLYFQIQLWSDVNTKITNLQINSLPTTTLTVDSKCYTLNSVICYHGQSMTEAHYTAIIKHQNKWVRCNDTSVQFERWPRGAKDVYIIIMEKK